MLYLHEVADVLAVRQDLTEALGAENISQSGLSKQVGGQISVHDVHDRHNRVEHVIEHCRVHLHRHRVFRQDLQHIHRQTTSYSLQCEPRKSPPPRYLTFFHLFFTNG